MQRATEFIWRAQHAELALLFSSEIAVPFYTTLGWIIVHGQVLCEQPGGVINYTQVAPEAPLMMLLPTEAKPSITSIDMRGLPW